jgi:hypothetical protein
MSEPICVGPGIGPKRHCDKCGEPLNETVEPHRCLGSREAVEEARNAEMRAWMASRPRALEAPPEPSPAAIEAAIEAFKRCELRGAVAGYIDMEAILRAAYRVDRGASRGTPISAVPPAPSAYDRLESLIREYTDSGECMECSAEVCRNVAHDVDCVIGQVATALTYSVDFGGSSIPVHASPGTPEPCPHVRTSAEGTSYCTLAEWAAPSPSAPTLTVAKLRQRIVSTTQHGPYEACDCASCKQLMRVLAALDGLGLHEGDQAPLFAGRLPTSPPEEPR